MNMSDDVLRVIINKCNVVSLRPLACANKLLYTLSAPILSQMQRRKIDVRRIIDYIKFGEVVCDSDVNSVFECFFNGGINRYIRNMEIAEMAANIHRPRLITLHPKLLLHSEFYKREQTRGQQLHI